MQSPFTGVKLGEGVQTGAELEAEVSAQVARAVPERLYCSPAPPLAALTLNVCPLCAVLLVVKSRTVGAPRVKELLTTPLVLMIGPMPIAFPAESSHNLRPAVVSCQQAMNPASGSGGGVPRFSYEPPPMPPPPLVFMVTNVTSPTP